MCIVSPLQRPTDRNLLEDHHVARCVEGWQHGGPNAGRYVQAILVQTVE